MVISIFIICNLLKSWNYLLFLCDKVRLFMQSRVCCRVRVTRRVEFTRRVRVWNYFPTRVHSRVTRWVKLSPNGYGYGWALPIGYVPVAIVSCDFSDKNKSISHWLLPVVTHTKTLSHTKRPRVMSAPTVVYYCRSECCATPPVKMSGNEARTAAVSLGK
jgi:hypothetical protein